MRLSQVRRRVATVFSLSRDRLLVIDGRRHLKVRLQFAPEYRTLIAHSLRPCSSPPGPRQDWFGSPLVHGGKSGHPLLEGSICLATRSSRRPSSPRSASGRTALRVSTMAGSQASTLSVLLLGLLDPSFSFLRRGVANLELCQLVLASTFMMDCS